MAGSAISAYGQGGIIFRNYQNPFNPVVWVGVTDADGRVGASEGVQLTLWFGEGILTPQELTMNVPLPWDPSPAAQGYHGYYGPTTVSLPGWSAGETWSFQIRASGDSIYGPVLESASRSVLWTEQASIADISQNPPGPPGVSSQSIGLSIVIPEPSTFALAGLGAAALMILRRRS